MSSLAPDSPAELAEMVRDAASAGTRLAVSGNGTKNGLGRPVTAERTLSTARLSGIRLYEPEELVITAAAGTPRAEIEAALSASGQHLAFEPPDLRALLGTEDRAETLGGIVAANLSGPRRFHSGAARDHLLGFQAVNGRGEPIKSGGRVVKNVTGFDLSKLICGSYGTLAVLTEVTLKVLPRPMDGATLLIRGLDAAAGVALAARALAMPFEISGAAWLPGVLAQGLGVGKGEDVTALRLEGPPESVADRLRELATLAFGSRRLDREQSLAFWQAIRDVHPLIEPRDRTVWKVSVAPQAGPELLAMIEGASFYLDWAGGLAWLSLPASGDCGAAQLRAATAQLGGHATLIRADAAIRAELPVFEPQPPALAALALRIKEGFDPAGILNPGRMYREI